MRAALNRRPLAFLLFIYIFIILLFHQLKIPPFYPVPASGDISGFIVEKKEATLEGTVCSYPEGSITSYGAYKLNFLFRPKGAGGIAKASIYNPKARYEYGDLLAIKGELARPSPPTNPGEFDYRGYLARQGIFTLIKVKRGSQVRLIKRNSANKALFHLFRLRRKFEGLIEENFPRQDAAVLSAILLGGRSDVPYEINDIFAKTGTAHILAISGLHVGLVAFIFLFFLKLARLPKKPRYFAVILLLVLYAALTGARPSVVRATIMAVIFLAGLILEREPDIYNTLAAAALMILAFRPRDLFDIGAQLSFASVLAIVYGTSVIAKSEISRLSLRGTLSEAKGTEAISARFFATLRMTLRVRLLRSLRSLAMTAVVSAAAFIGVMPLVARYFNIVTPVALLANLIIVPLMSVALGSSLLFLGAASISPIGLSFFQLPASFSLWLLRSLAEALSRAPFAYFYIRPPSVSEIVLYYALIAAAANYRRLKPARYAAPVLLFLFLSIFLLRGISHYERGALDITFLDVGSGDAIFVRFPNGKNMLIDAGTEDGARFVVLPYLRYEGINRLNALVLTHPHSDHIGGAPLLIQNFALERLFDNGRGADNSAYREYKGLIGRSHIRYAALSSSDEIDICRAARIITLGPPRGFISGAKGAVNDNSVALRLAYEGRSMLFLADLEERGISRLLEDELPLKADLIKAPHHGSSISPAGERLLDAAAPSVVLISAPRAGRFKFPSDELLSRLASRKISVYTTKEDGAISVSVKRGGGMIIKTYYNH